MLILLALPWVQDAATPSFQVERRRGDDRFSITSVEPLPGGRSAWTWVRLRGRSGLPEKAVLRIEFTSIRERRVAGRLARSAGEQTSALVQVKDGVFVLEHSLVWATEWELTITAPDDLQNPPVLARLRDEIGDRSWGYVLALTHVFKSMLLSDELEGVFRRAKEARGPVMALAAGLASGSPDALNEHLKSFRASMRGVGLHRSTIFSAAETEQLAVVGTAQEAASRLVWQGGRAVVLQPPGQGPLVTHRGEPFSCEALLVYLTESEEASGRELLLLALRDARRGALGPEHGKALSKVREIRGLAPLGDRLKPEADLDALEKDLRTFDSR